MFVKLTGLQSNNNQFSRLQPTISAEQVRNEVSSSISDTDNATAASGSTVAFSQEAVDAALLDKANVRIGDIESVRNFLSKYDFNSISPNDLGKVVGATLSAAKMISGEELTFLIGTELAYEPPLDANQPMDAVKLFDTTLAASKSVGSSIEGNIYHEKAANFIIRLASFALSDRTSI